MSDQFDWLEPQKYAGEYREGKMNSCAITCVVNALKILKKEDKDEDEVIDDMGGKGKVFDEMGLVSMGRVRDYLVGQNLQVKKTESVGEVMQALVEGGVAMAAYGGHVRLIFGARSEEGKTILKMHDPAHSIPTEVAMEELEQELKASGKFSLWCVTGDIMNRGGNHARR